MNRRRFLQLTGAAGLGALAPRIAEAAADFTLAFFPDEHVNQHGGSLGQYQDLQNWLVANSKTGSWNIQGIFSTGDFGDTLTDQQNAWTYGGSLYTAPWLYGIGNHDYQNADGSLDGTATVLTSRRTDIFDANLGYTKASAQTGYSGAAMAGALVNQYITFSVGTRKFMVLALEHWARDSALTWAAGVINTYAAANPTVEIIILTHGYMEPDATLAGPYDAWGSNTSTTSVANSGTGIATWAKQFPNVRMIHCGHTLGGSGTNGWNLLYHGHRVDVANDGHAILGFRQNWQDSYADGYNLWGRGVTLIKFKASGGIEVTPATVTGTTLTISGLSFPTFGGSPTVGTCRTIVVLITRPGALLQKCSRQS